MRSYIISNICGSASSIFSITTATVYRGDIYSRGYERSTIPEIVTALKNPTKPNDPYPRYPSILYKDGVVNGNNLFGSEAIINVCIFLLRCR